MPPSRKFIVVSGTVWKLSICATGVKRSNVPPTTSTTLSGAPEGSGLARARRPTPGVSAASRELALELAALERPLAAQRAQQVGDALAHRRRADLVGDLDVGQRAFERDRLELRPFEILLRQRHAAEDVAALFV
jgi:hypothetical protein